MIYQYFILLSFITLCFIYRLKKQSFDSRYKKLIDYLQDKTIYLCKAFLVISLLIGLYDAETSGGEELLLNPLVLGIITIIILSLSNLQAYTERGFVFAICGNLIANAIMLKQFSFIDSGFCLLVYTAFYLLYCIVFLNLHRIYTFCSKNFKK